MELCACSLVVTKPQWEQLQVHAIGLARGSTPRVTAQHIAVLSICYMTQHSTNMVWAMHTPQAQA